MSGLQTDRRAVLRAIGIGTVTSGIGIRGIGRGRASTGETDVTDWPQFRGGAAHSGSTAATHPDAVDRDLWAVGSESQPASAPAVDGGTAYVGIGSELLTLDVASGSGVWRAAVGDRIVLSPAVGTDNVFVTTDGGDVVALSKADGSEQWRIGLGGKPGAPTVTEGTVFAGSTNDRIVALEAASGDVRWTDSREVDSSYVEHTGQRPTPAVSDGTVFVNITRYDGALVALDAATGEEQWAQQFDDASEILTPAVANGKVAVSIMDRPKIQVLSAEGGVRQWETEIDSSLNYYPAAVDDGLLAFLTDRLHGEMTLYAYDLDSGEQRWSYDAEWSPYGVSIGSEAIYFTTSKDGNSGVVGAVGRENGFELFTQETDVPRIPAHGPIPTGETLLIPDGYRVCALGPAEESATATQTTSDESDATPAPTTVEQESEETTEAAANRDGADENRAIIEGTNLFSLEVIGTLATVLASIGTLLQLLQGGD